MWDCVLSIKEPNRNQQENARKVTRVLIRLQMQIAEYKSPRSIY